MNLFPKLKNCPWCDTTNLIKVNGVKYENPFHTLNEWTLDKKFNCRKCKVELGLFSNSKNNQEKTIWLEYYKFEDDYYDEIKKLKALASKNKKSGKSFYEIFEKIQKIQNEIHSSKLKLKIKKKIQNKGVVSYTIF